MTKIWNPMDGLKFPEPFHVGDIPDPKDWMLNDEEWKNVINSTTHVFNPDAEYNRYTLDDIPYIEVPVIGLDKSMVTVNLKDKILTISMKEWPTGPRKKYTDFYLKRPAKEMTFMLNENESVVGSKVGAMRLSIATRVGCNS